MGIGDVKFRGSVNFLPVFPVVLSEICPSETDFCPTWGAAAPYPLPPASHVYANNTVYRLTFALPMQYLLFYSTFVFIMMRFIIIHHQRLEYRISSKASRPSKISQVKNKPRFSKLHGAATLGNGVHFL